MDQFFIASTEDILSGKMTDAYFARTLQVLRQKEIDRQVVMEFRANALPEGSTRAVLAGVEEIVYLLRQVGKPIDFYCLDEGTLFRAGEPVAYLMGNYQDLCLYETALLGLMSQASGIATRAARCAKAAEGRPVLFFGARRLHPALAPMADRSAYLGGCQGFSTQYSAERFGLNAFGTMPHSVVILLGDTVEALEMFDEVLPERVPRICLVDTLLDEKFEAVRVAQAFGPKLYGLRLDTPESRRGNLGEILRELRWELNLRGYERVRLIASGGINEAKIRELNPWCYGYGVGTWVSNAPVVDFSLDIVEVEGAPFAKRGRWAGRKRLLPPPHPRGERRIVPWLADDPNAASDLLTAKIRQGECIINLPRLQEMREHVLQQLAQADL